MSRKYQHPNEQTAQPVSTARPATPIDRKSRAIKTVLVGTVIAVLAFDVYSFTVHLPGRKGSLNRWLPITEIIDSGPGIYQQRPDYLYPPIFLIIIKPLARLDMPLRAVVFQLIKQGLMIVAIVLGWKVANNSFGRLKPILLVAGVILTARFLASDLGHGNVNLLMLMLVMLTLWLWQTGRNAIAGLPLALAVSIKLTPVLIVVYAVYKRQWRLLAGVTAGLLIFLVLLPGAYLGFSKNLATMHAWADHVIVPFATQMDTATLHTNQSLAGTLMRYLTHVPAMDRPQRYINLTNLTQQQVKHIFRFCVAAILLFSLYALRGKIQNTNTAQFAVHLSIIQVLMLLFSRYAWHAHFVYLFLPYLTILAMWHRSPRGLARTCLAGSIVASYILGSVMTSWAGPYWSDMFDSYGVLTAAAVVLLIMLVLNSGRSFSTLTTSR